LLFGPNAVDSCKQLGENLVHPKHPKKDVDAALDYAEDLGHMVERTVAGHKWGRITCSLGHRASVWSTPRTAVHHAHDLRKWAIQHWHDDGGG
jgi:hypothetical protein